jgi:hypothetical protein
MYRWKKYILKKANEQLLDELNKGSGNWAFIFSHVKHLG